MNSYHKIQTVYKRNPETNLKTLLEGEFSLPEFEYLKHNNWTWTEKIDGTNIRVMIDSEGQLKFGGKTDKSQIPSQLVNWLNDKFISQKENIEKIFKDTNVCLYGEGYGAKIQKGGNYCSYQKFILFDIKIGEWWLKRIDIEDIANQLDIEIVPIIGNGTLFEMIEYTRNGFNSQWGNFLAEGIVARPSTELFARNGRRIITKIKHEDFRMVNKT